MLHQEIPILCILQNKCSLVNRLRQKLIRGLFHHLKNQELFGGPGIHGPTGPNRSKIFKIVLVLVRSQVWKFFSVLVRSGPILGPRPNRSVRNQPVLVLRVVSFGLVRHPWTMSLVLKF